MKRLAYILVIGLSLMLSACSIFQQPTPEPEIKYVPTPVACVKSIPAEPELVHDKLNETTPLDTLYESALLDKQRLQRYALDLRIEVEACSQIPPVTPAQP